MLLLFSPFDIPHHCAAAQADPSEYTDLASQMPDVLTRLSAKLDAVVPYQTNETPGYNTCVSNNAWAQAHHNFLGPLCTKSNSTSPQAASVSAPVDVEPRPQEEETAAALAEEDAFRI